MWKYTNLQAGSEAQPWSRAIPEGAAKGQPAPRQVAGPGPGLSFQQIWRRLVQTRARELRYMTIWCKFG